MSWPVSRPGEPADHDRPWHWVSRVEDGGSHPLPLGWNPHLRHWVLWDGATIAPEEAARRFAYLGPCMTPAETEAKLAEAVAAATPAAPPPEAEPRGLAALAASALPEPPPEMVYKKKAMVMHLMIFAGTLFGTLFIAEKFILR
ncbi:hypothetical protein [Falsiroseomonas sp. HW251]|uniref:hypothetical protein n=1 Tax=Falsiroseomonas sp. HW251 TaxID=3390998 RepID=UPI003D322568